MKTMRWVVLGLLGCALQHAQAAFLAPSEEQIKAVAEAPQQVGPLLREASPIEAAGVVKDVIIKIVGSGLPPVTRDQRIAAVISQAYRAMKGKEQAFAVALGRAIAASPGANTTADVVSAVQQALVTAGGAQAGTGFGNSYNMAMQTVAGAPGGGKSVPPAPPPPPVATPYNGQNLP